MLSKSGAITQQMNTERYNSSIALVELYLQSFVYTSEDIDTR